MKRLIPILLLAVLGQSCREAETKPPPERPRTPVETERVQLATLVDRLRLHAEVHPVAETHLSSGSGGKVDAVLVDDSSRVSRGQLLARIGADLAEAQLKQAEASEKAAQSSHARAKRLAAQNLTSSAALERAETALAQSQAALELARVRHSDALVRAPHAGVVAKRHVSLGEQAFPGAPLFDLVDLSEVDLVVQIAERDAPLIEVGSSARATIDAMPDEVFEGRVHRIGTVAHTHSRTFDVEVRVANRERKLKPGMLARVELVRRTLENVAVIRRDAVVEGLHGPGVYVAVDGKAKQVPVRLGPVENERVAVLEGLSPEDEIVVVGQRSLVDGEPIRVPGRAFDQGGGELPVAGRAVPKDKAQATP